MDLGRRRVLIGFRGSRAVASLQGDDLSVDGAVAVEVASAPRMPSAYAAGGGDVIAEINRRRSEAPVLPGAVTESNIADAQLDPAAVFDPASDPLDAPRGGTGLGAVPTGALLAGGGVGPAAVVPGVSFVGGVLTTPSLTVGDWRLAAVDDGTGRRTVVAENSETGCNVDLLLAGRQDVRTPTLTLATGGAGQVTMEASAPDDLVRVVHFDWRPSPSGDRAPAQVARSPSKSVRVDPDGIARYTATGLTPATAYDFRAAAEDGRGNVSGVVTAQATVAASP